MNRYPIIRDPAVRSLLNHPMYHVLREMIARHEGPWKEADIKALNAEMLVDLHFWVENGRLHFGRVNPKEILSTSEGSTTPSIGRAPCPADTPPET